MEHMLYYLIRGRLVWLVNGGGDAQHHQHRERERERRKQQNFELLQ